MKGVIFDFNGVLFWDSHIHERVWNEFAIKMRGKPLTKHELDTYFHGRTNKSCFAYILGRSINSHELSALINQREAFYRSLCLASPKEFVLSPGSVQLLTFLMNQHIPYTIATSAEITNVTFFFKHLQLEKWFDIKNVAYDDGTIQSKPAPDVYINAAKKIGIAPQECLAVEDAQSGIAAARSAGIGMIVALGERQKKDVLVRIPGVKMSIEKLDELIPYL